MSKQMEAVRKAQDAVYAAQDRLATAVEKAFPPFSKSAYEIGGGNWVPCVVLRTSGDRVRVRSARSGKEYWVYATRFLQRTH